MSWIEIAVSAVLITVVAVIYFLPSEVQEILQHWLGA